MTCSFPKADSITDFVAVVYSKGLNIAKTDFATDFVSAISSKGLKLYKKQSLSQPTAKNRLCHTLHQCHL